MSSDSFQAQVTVINIVYCRTCVDVACVLSLLWLLPPPASFPQSSCSLGSPESRVWDKDWGAGSLFQRWPLDARVRAEILVEGRMERLRRVQYWNIELVTTLSTQDSISLATIWRSVLSAPRITHHSPTPHHRFEGWSIIHPLLAPPLPSLLNSCFPASH